MKKRTKQIMTRLSKKIKYKAKVNNIYQVVKYSSSLTHYIITHRNRKHYTVERYIGNKFCKVVNFSTKGFNNAISNGNVKKTNLDVDTFRLLYKDKVI